MTAPALTLSVEIILALKENTATDPHVLELTIENCMRLYGEAACATSAAWDMYDAAIDDEKPHSEVENLFGMAITFEAEKEQARIRLDEAKRERLMLMN